MPTVTGKASSFINFFRPGASGGGATLTDRDGKIKWAGHNLLTNSESFDASAWTKETGVTVTANAVASPNGTTTADQVDMSSTGNGIYQAVSVLASTAYTAGVWVRGDASGTITIRPAFGGTSSSVSVTTEWQYVTIAVNTANTTNGLYVQRGAGNLSRVYLWGAHLYRSDLGGMVFNPAMPAGMGTYYPTTPRNLLGYTEDFSNAYWAKGAATITSNAIVAPNGLQTADKIVENTANTSHGVNSPTITGVANTPYVLSVYAKAAERSWIWINFNDGSNRRSWFNLASGTTGTVAAGCTATITSVGNGWYLCSVSRVAASATLSFSFIAATADNSTVYTGDGTSGIYLWGAQLSDSASLDTYVPVYGAAVTSAAYYAPRLDYSSTTLQPLGLLVEEQRTNLLSYSADFADIYWGKSGSTISADAVASPGGDLTADKLVEAGTDAQHRIAKTIGVTSGVAYTFSVYVKAGERTAVWLRVTSTVTVASITVNLSNGSVESPPVHPYSVTNVGNGWYRVTITGTPDSSTATCYANIINNTGANTYLGDGTSGIYIWGAQLEAGSFATSYIPTGASTATRAADVASVSTQAFPYNASEGSLVASFQLLTGSAGSTNVVALESGVNNITLYRDASTWRYRTSLASLNITGISNVNVNKVALAYAASDYPVSTNGTAIQTNAGVGSVPAAETLQIGRGNTYGATTPINGHIRQITYIPRRLSNAELQSRSA